MKTSIKMLVGFGIFAILFLVVLLVVAKLAGPAAAGIAGAVRTGASKFV
jgi:hypothetical protein